MRNPFDVYTNSRPANSRGKGLEWDEAALDDQSKVEGFAEEQRSLPAFRWLKMLLLLACVVLGGKLFSLQILRGENFRLLAEGNRIRNQIVLAPRGFIRDRNGEVL